MTHTRTSSTSLLALATAVALLIVSAAVGGGAGGTPEGIQVHGHWVIDVFNPDGSQAGRHEFDNALIGADALVGILSREIVPAEWVIAVSGFDASDTLSESVPSPCGTVSDPHRRCVIVEPDEELLPGEQFPNLEVVNDAGIHVRLAGNLTASQDGRVGFVETYMELCAVGDDCSVAEGEFRQFTAKEIFNPDDASLGIPVSAGQAVRVVVELSFS